LRLLEYQVKGIFNDYGIKIPDSTFISSLDDIENAVEKIGNYSVIKAQVPMGKRGKAGGIKFSKTKEEAIKQAKALLGSRLNEYTVHALLIEEKLDISDEYYLSVITDTQRQSPMVIVSSKGGIDIEETAKQSPEKILRLSVDPLYGLSSYQILHLITLAGFKSSILAKCVKLIKTLYKIYWEKDCQLVEINPLVVTKNGELSAADAKMIVDDNAIFRQIEMKSLRQLNETQKKVESARINYIPMDGDIGIIGTGAGMAMVNLDQIAHFGGKPANFMDVGPSINVHGAKAGLDILFRRKDLKALLISGYTGSRLDIFANDIIDALNENPDIKIPIVIRLQGRNEEKAHEILKNCKYKNIHFCDDFDRAAELVVQLSRNE